MSVTRHVLVSEVYLYLNCYCHDCVIQQVLVLTPRGLHNALL